jgi:two-component system KDP operon response regulator KdpE
VSGQPAPETSGSKPLALVVEGAARMRKFLSATLLARGYGVAEAASGREGLLHAAIRAPDFILLGLGLPDLDGVEVIKQLREWTATPIIVVSARGQERKKVEALDAGADDYLTRPFGSTELMTRLRVALKHATPNTREATNAVVIVGELRIDLMRRLVFVGDREVHLTPIEYKLFALLMKHSDKVLTQRQLLDDVWGPGHEEGKQSLRDCLMQLRKKLEPDPARPRYIVTEAGVGYRIKVPRDARA